jgi:hypothetical protein
VMHERDAATRPISNPRIRFSSAGTEGPTSDRPDSGRSLVHTLVTPGPR